MINCIVVKRGPTHGRR